MGRAFLSTTDHLRIVRSIPLFAGLTDEEKDGFLKNGNIYSYKRKETIFQQGEPIKFLYIVAEGIVQEFSQTYGGYEITQNLHKEGDIICKTEMFLQDDVHQTGAAAVSDVHVMELPVQAFKQNILQHSSAATSFLSSLAEHSFMKQREIEQKMTMSATEILASFLKDAGKTYGLDSRSFTLPFKKSLIASRLGMELETLSRTLPKLKEHGITVKGSQVFFHEA